MARELNILTLKFGDKYGPEYVNRLYAGLRRNSTIDFDFFCYTDNTNGLRQEIKTIPLDPSVNSHWQKLEFHKRGFMPEGSKCLILDIDWVILKNIDDVLSTPINSESHLVSVERWWSHMYDSCPLNGGFQMFINGETDHLWQTYESKKEYWRNYFYDKGDIFTHGMGEQNFIHMNNYKPIQFLDRSWFGKFVSDEGIKQSMDQLWLSRVNNYDPYFIGNEINDSIKMIHFTSQFDCYNNDNCISNHSWIKEHWHDNY